MYTVVDDFTLMDIFNIRTHTLCLLLIFLYYFHSAEMYSNRIAHNKKIRIPVIDFNIVVSQTLPLY